MPDLWDANPDHVFNTRGDQPDPAPNGQDDQTHEMKLKDSSGRLRLPAYILIALVMGRTGQDQLGGPEYVPSNPGR